MQFGVFQVLFQANLLPRVFTGSSAGSIGGWPAAVLAALGGLAAW